MNSHLQRCSLQMAMVPNDQPITWKQVFSVSESPLHPERLPVS